MSPSQRARGVISGVGRGLVGAVIKPLGGAAEFVAQAGQGKYPTLPENFGKALCAAFKQYLLTLNVPKSHIHVCTTYSNTHKVHRGVIPLAR